MHERGGWNGKAGRVSSEFAARTGALFGFAKRMGRLSPAVAEPVVQGTTLQFTATRQRAGVLRIDVKD